MKQNTNFTAALCGIVLVALIGALMMAGCWALLSLVNTAKANAQPGTQERAVEVLVAPRGLWAPMQVGDQKFVCVSPDPLKGTPFVCVSMGQVTTLSPIEDAITNERGI